MATHPLTLNLVMQKARADRPQLVRRLNVSGSQVDDIGVLDQLPNLEVCSLAANDITDLGPLSGCEGLRELFLRKNDVVDLFQVLHLRGLSRLRTLTLCENPIAQHDCYRRYVIAALPQLEKLDDQVVAPEERAAASAEFPDVTSCDIPLPLPTKRELHENKSQQGSPNLRKTPSGTSAFANAPPPADAPPSGRPSSATPRTTPPSVPPPQAPANQSPSAVPARAPEGAAGRRVSRDESSDVPTETSEVEGPTHDDLPVGGRGGRRLHADPSRNHAEEDSNDSFAEELPASRSQQRPVSARAGRGLRGGLVRSSVASSTAVAAERPPGIPLSPQPLGIREENVVRAINVLLGELSPVGLDAIRRQLDMLEMR